MGKANTKTLNPTEIHTRVDSSQKSDYLTTNPLDHIQRIAKSQVNCFLRHLLFPVRAVLSTYESFECE